MHRYVVASSDTFLRMKIDPAHSGAAVSTVGWANGEPQPLIQTDYI